MNTILLVLLLNVAVSALLFLLVLTRLSWEDADWWVKAISAEFATVVFFTGLLALYTGGVVNEKLTATVAALGRETAGLQKEVAEARAKQAEAELALEQVRKKQEPRRLKWDAFVHALKGRPTGTAMIVYQPNDPEAYHLAVDIWMALGSAQWQTTEPQPAPPSPRSSPPILNPGVSVVANDINGAFPPYTGEDNAARALAEAVFDSLGGTHGGRDESLPDNVFRVVVGPKP